MKCKKCGNRIEQNAKFCSNCGTEVKNKKNIILLVIIAILIIIVGVLLALWIINKNNSQKDNFSSESSNSLISYTYSDNNNVKFIDGNFSDIKIKSSDDVLKALESIKDKIGFSDIKNELVLNSEEVSEEITYYKFNQVYKSLNVFNQNIIIAVDKDNNIISYSGYYIPNIDIDINPQKTKEDIEEIAKQNLGENPNIISNDLMVWASYDSQSLVYIINGYSDTKAVQLIIDSHTGEILAESNFFDFANTYSYTGTGIDNKTYTINLEEYFDVLLGSEKRYNFYDPERKISIADFRLIDPVFGMLYSALPGTTPINVSMVDGQIDMTYENHKFIQDAITTMAHFETIYDYYKNILGRNSFDNRGSKIIVNLGVSGKLFTNEDYNNASWNSLSKQMFIGDWKGKSLSASLDVLAHEFTHGVVDYTAEFAGTPKKTDKNKAFETGALNEAYADILGSLIEGQNWTMAENNEILRSAVNPEEFDYPSVKGGKFYYPDGYLSDGKTLEELLQKNGWEYVSDYDDGGEHHNSTVVSHAAYLMHEAGAFKSREEMAKVWYNSLFMLSSYSSFEDCALAVIKSAKNLGLSNETISKITKAFTDTNMLEEKEQLLSGNISSGDNKLKDAKVSIYSIEGVLIDSYKTKENGKYEIKVPTGNYKVEVTKKGFEKYTGVIGVNGETNLDISLAKEGEMEKDNFQNSCQTSKCYNLTIYYVDGSESDELKETSETHAYDAGTIIGANLIVDAVNKGIGSEWLKTDGKSFYVYMGEIKFEFAFYYRGTDTKFDWDKPINEDIDIEMRFFDGILGNDTLLDLFS